MTFDKKSTLLVLEDATLHAGFEWLQKNRHTFSGMVLMGTQTQFPFEACPSKFMVPLLPNHLIAANPCLEDWGIVSRLATLSYQPGCFEGTIHAFAKLILLQKSFAHILRVI